MQILIMGHFDFLFHCLHILSTEKINLIFFFAVHTDNLQRIIMLFAKSTYAAKCSLFHKN